MSSLGPLGMGEASARWCEEREEKFPYRKRNNSGNIEQARPDDPVGRGTPNVEVCSYFDIIIPCSTFDIQNFAIAKN